MQAALRLILFAQTRGQQLHLPSQGSDLGHQRTPVTLRRGAGWALCRLGYGGRTPKLVGCEILELTDIGALVETYAQVDAMAKFFTLEIDGQYHRAQLVKSKGRQILLAFFKEELNYIEAP